MVRGNTISRDIVQINCKIIKEGTKPIEELVKKKEEKTEEKVEEKQEVKEKEEKSKKEEIKEEGGEALRENKSQVDTRS